MSSKTATITLSVESRLLEKFRIACERDGITPTGALAKHIQEYVELFEECQGPIGLRGAT